MSIQYKIFADFNNADAQGRLRLTTNGSLTDIQAQNITFEQGMHVTLCDHEDEPGRAFYYPESNGGRY